MKVLSFIKEKLENNINNLRLTYANKLVSEIVNNEVLNSC